MIRMVLIRTLSRMKTIRISRNGHDKNATVLYSMGNGESGGRFGRDGFRVRVWGIGVGAVQVLGGLNPAGPKQPQKVEEPQS